MFEQYELRLLLTVHSSNVVILFENNFIIFLRQIVKQTAFIVIQSNYRDEITIYPHKTY